MLLLQQGLRFAARRMPKVISPGAHAVLDYAFAAAFAAMGARQWRDNRRVAVTCLGFAGATALNALLTDYPGGVFRLMSYRTHGRFDAGIVAVTAAAPQVMGFGDQAESRFFSAQAIAGTVVAGMTDYNYYSDAEEEHPLKAVS
ncbi:MAG TPA: hypothetical protein VGG15_00760 [Terriglobales bacterium]|jgi:hypothetical protein